jgi:hypothetical protein
MELEEVCGEHKQEEHVGGVVCAGVGSLEYVYEETREDDEKGASVERLVLEYAGGAVYEDGRYAPIAKGVLVSRCGCR